MRVRWCSPLLAATLAGTSLACDRDWTGDDDITDPGDDDTTEPADDDTTDDDDSTEPPAVTSQAVAPTGLGASTRWAYEEAYGSDGDWYIGQDNENATLAWGESYVMMSLAAAFRATGDPDYLAELARHADSALAMRDDHRGVTDYRGISGACWRNLHYQPADQPYCYVVHSGMIGFPMVELARLVRAFGLEAEPALDGTTLGDKADAYLEAAAETVAIHDDQWRDAGYYVFRPDATFLAYAGSDLPLNQSNAMGRLLIALYEVTGDPALTDKAQKLALRFADQITVGDDGAYLWNYWGGPYSGSGEDISHAAINVDFAAMAAAAGLAFDADDLDGFATTFVERVVVDDRTISDAVGGGSTNGASYRPQAGRWLRLSPTRNGVYGAVRDLFEADYPPESAGATAALTWAYLAEFQPRSCEPFFYYVDWDDPDPHSTGDWRQATAYGANLLTAPDPLDERCQIPLEVDAPRAVAVQQWDGAEYHDVARWQATGGATLRHLTYEPRWDHVYWSDGVLFQFADGFVEGDGILVRESEGHDTTEILSTPPATGEVGQPLDYHAFGLGEEPLWWSLTTFPVSARIDPGSGVVAWTPPAPGVYPFTVRFQGDWGLDEQSFEVVVGGR